MAQGNQRREGVQDVLAGKRVEVTTRSAAPLSVPQVQTPDVMNSQASKIGRALVNFSSKAFQDAANVQHEAAALDGQMAHMQGQAIEDVEMEGDKWKLSGYRIMDAQSISASMLAAQQEMIRQSQYEDDPDTFRATFVNRLEQQIDGLDPQTASLVRKQMASQLPALVGQHTTAHMAYQEEEAYKALERSVDVIGQDETQLDNFIANVTGEGGSGGLSQARRTAAVSAGVVRAFQAGNPLAFARIKRANALTEFSTQEIAQMEAAEKGYQQKLRTTLNDEYIEEMLNFEQEVATGKVPVSEAIERQAAIMAKYGMDMTMQEGKATGLEAQQQRELYTEGNTVLYKDAMARGDYEAVAELSFETVVWHESKGRNVSGPLITAGANAGDRAMGAAQVMPKTAANPGYGIRPANLDEPDPAKRAADVYRVGKELWARHVKHYKGDVEAAAIAYNAGPANADKWLAAGRDYSVLPKPEETQPYATSIAADIGQGGRRISATNRLAAAEAQAKSTAELLGIQEYTELSVNMDTLNQEFLNPEGTMTEAEYFKQAIDLLAATDNHFTTAGVNAVHGIIKQQRADAEAVLEQEAKDTESVDLADRKERFKMARNAADAEYEVNMAAAQEAGDLDAQVRLTQEHQQSLMDDIDAAGLTLAESGAAAEQRTSLQAMTKALKAKMKTDVEQGLIARAVATNTVADLPKNLQTEAFKQMEEKRIADIEEVRAEQPEVTPEDAAELFATQEVKDWQAAGMVDPARAAEMTRVLAPANLLSQDGKANPNVVALLSQYDQLVIANGREFADQMFTDEATRMRAEHIRALANNSGNPAELAGAVVMKATSPEFSSRAAYDAAGEPTAEALAEAAEVARGIREGGLLTEGAVDEADAGWVQALLSSDVDMADRFDTTSTESERREQYREEYADHVQDRIMELLRISPTLTAKDVGERAQRDVAARTSFIGGDMIYLDKPSDTPRAQMFGHRASEFDGPLMENEAVIDWLAAKSEEEGYGFISDVLWREALPFNAGAAIPNIVNFFGGNMTEPQQGYLDSRATKKRGGVRNIDSTTIYGVDGAGNPLMMVTIIDAAGQSRNIPIDMQEAGQMYMDKQDAEARQ